MKYVTIVLPTRAQPDTIVAIFILKTLGVNKFAGIGDASVEVWQSLPEGTSDNGLDERGIVLIDIGGGRFDHHGRSPRTTASKLVADYLGLSNDPALRKLLAYAERDDFYGKGIVSTDPLDRAFGLSGLIANLNRKYVEDHARVVEIILPLLEAHYEEEVRRTRELPEELVRVTQEGGVETFRVRQDGKNLDCIYIESSSASMAGFLRSQNGGRYDVIIQRMETGHTNILTRPTKKIDLRNLVGVIRESEMIKKGIEIGKSDELLTAPGKIDVVPEWYFDPATNSIQNGGLNPTSISATALSRTELIQLVEIGLTF